MNQQVNNNKPAAVLPRRSRRLATIIPASHWVSLEYSQEEAQGMEKLQNDMKNYCDNDDVDISSIGNGKILEYNSTTGKMQFVSSGSEVTNLEVLGTIIFEGSTADDFETTISVVDPTADRTITIPNETGTLITSTNGATRAFSIALAAALG